MQTRANELETKIGCLRCDLSSHASAVGDWKVIKCYEAKLKGEELPYDLDKLLADRQAIRDQINALQAELQELKAALASAREA